MKKIVLLMLLVVMMNLVSGCISSQSSKPILVQSAGAPGVGVYRRLPSPRVGLTIVINRNEHLQANCCLFQGYMSRREMFASHPESGQPMFSRPPILQFTISPSFDRHQWRYKALQLSPSRARYTLFVVWTRVTGRVVDTETRSFSTTGYPFNKYRLYSSPFKQVILADRFVHLRRIHGNYRTRFRVDKTIPLGQIVKDIVGLP